ncbi:MAG: serine/threonine-protein kinase [Polyangiales bacterium]
MTTVLVDYFGLVGATLEGRFDVERVVAEGGFGVVYRATHCGLHRPVAIKVLKTPAHLDPALRGPFLETFAQEARVIAALDHPAIVRVLDFGVSAMPTGDVAPWSCLEWIEGTSLEAHLAERGESNGLDPVHAFQLLEPVVEAIAYAHDEGVVHRDLKPANLMLVRSRRNETTLRVLDFGIAKLMGREERTASSHTATSSAMQACSLPYAAPEQLTAMRTGPWTDVHALALILVEVITGLAPIVGDDVAELYASALAPKRPTPLACGVDVGAWEPVLARALAFKPADRFADARALLDALRASLPGTCRRRLVAEREAPLPIESTTPQLATLRGTTHPSVPRSPSSAWRFALAVGCLLALAAAGGRWALSASDAPVTSGRSTGSSSASSGRGAPSPLKIPPPIAASPPTVDDEAHDSGASANASVDARSTSGGHARARSGIHGESTRRRIVGAPSGEVRPASSSEQLPVE